MQTEDSLFSQLKHEARTATQTLDPADLALAVIGAFQHAGQYQAHRWQATFVQAGLAAGTDGLCFNYGVCEALAAQPFLGQPALQALGQVPRDAEIAIVDAVFGLLPHRLPAPWRTVELTGRATDKAVQRGAALATLLQPQPGEKVGVIGSVGQIIQPLVNLGCAVRIADWDARYPAICGVPLEKDFLAITHWADKLIVTGNTLFTQTLDPILDIVRTDQKAALIYAMTGHHFAPRYLEHGATMVTSEAPFFMFPSMMRQLQVFANDAL